MKKYLFLLACFGFLMAQCHKESDSTEATVKGRVLEADSDVGIANMTVQLVEEDYPPSSWTPKRTTLKITKTDATGNYQFSYTRFNALNYDVVAVNSSTDYNEYTQNVLIPDGVANTVNIFLSPYGWLKFHIKNERPFDQNDLAIFTYGTFSGTNVDTVFIVKVGGNRKVPNQLGIRTIKNGVQTFKNIDIIVPPHDTTKLDIFY